jgi:gamma-glutamylaminecyclotransferase
MFRKEVSVLTDEMNDESADERQDRSPTRIFVYGTLMQREHNHRLLARSAFLGEARTKEGFALNDLGGCPGMTSAGSGRVSGEVYAVTPDVLHALDELEGHPDWYERAPIELEDGRRVEAYLMTAEQVQGAGRIPSGDWRRRAQPPTR